MELPRPRGNDPRLDGRTRFGSALVPDFLPADRLNIDTQIESIAQRSRQASSIPIDSRPRTAALTLTVAEKAARTRVHRRDERDPCRKRHRAARSRDVDRALLEWLSQT